MITIETVQQTISMTVAAALLIMIILLFVKKSTFNFNDLANAITYGGVDSARRYYGNKAVVRNVKQEYTAQDCEYGTKLIMADALKEPRNIGKVLLKHPMLAEYGNELPCDELRILKMKRIDLGISDKEIKVLYTVNATMGVSTKTCELVLIKFEITYESNWYATVDKVTVCDQKGIL